MTHRIATIGRYTVLEALRTRLSLSTAALVCILLIASFFVREIAITDSARFQTAFYAASVRFGMVFVVALHVIASVSRDFQDKGLDMVLALDLPRSHYCLGKLAGFLAIAAAAALLAALPLFALTAPEPAVQWLASLALELALVASLSLFCVMTFTSLMPAASFVLAFYLLARAITAIRLIGSNPIAGGDAPSHQVLQMLVEGLALLVPALDGWTRTEWLVNEVAPWGALGAITLHGALFIAIFSAAAVFDMHRRNF
jgi:ABC-type transport system involved in multi-copper enzyme maturation permease subunit